MELAQAGRRALWLWGHFLTHWGPLPRLKYRSPPTEGLPPADGTRPNDGTRPTTRWRVPTHRWPKTQRWAVTDRWPTNNWWATTQDPLFGRNPPTGHDQNQPMGHEPLMESHRFSRWGWTHVDERVMGAPSMRTVRMSLRMVTVVPRTKIEKRKVQMGSAILYSGWGGNTQNRRPLIWSTGFFKNSDFPKSRQVRHYLPF